MNFIENTLEVTAMLIYYLQAQTEIETEDVYEVFYGDKNLLDFSDYPQDWKLFILVNKKITGKMKGEFKGEIISEFVGLKSKMYILIDVNGEEIKIAKGVNKNVENTRHKEFVDALFNKNWQDTEWNKFKVNYIKFELMMFAKFLCLVLMIKDTY